VRHVEVHLQAMAQIPHLPCIGELIDPTRNCPDSGCRLMQHCRGAPWNDAITGPSRSR